MHRPHSLAVVSIDFFRSSNATVHKNLKPIVDIMKSPEVSQSLGTLGYTILVLCIYSLGKNIYLYMRRVIQCVRWGPVQALDGDERRLYFKISTANARLDH